MATEIEQQHEAQTEQSNSDGPRRSEQGRIALANAKKAVKLFDAIMNFEIETNQQRAVVRELMEKHAAAMNRKLMGLAAAEGEDFASINKRLTKENNRLDNMLEGKEALFSKVREAANAVIADFKEIIVQVHEMEEGG